ncbi:MAG TPA: hypothetical protein VLX29_00505 [Nitrospirota bacterium]|nr:hypothetical protein [Nitrospirota bacterium]
MQKIYRTALWLRAVIVFCTLIPAFSLLILYPIQGASFVVVCLLTLVMLGILASVETIILRIVIFEDTVSIVKLFRKKVFNRNGVIGAKIEGGKVFLQLSRGKFYKLPELGHSARMIYDEVSHWLKTREKSL